MSTSAPPRVCIVDDDPAVLRGLGLLLRTMGFAVEVFTSAEAFLQAAHRPLPDCVVIDIHLGGLDGFALHERLTAAGVIIPTVFITGHDDVETRARARRTDAAGYLAKPCDDRALVAAIEHAVHP
jgi:two-component system, LuxR family, response regulator FixJ